MALAIPFAFGFKKARRPRRLPVESGEGIGAGQNQDVYSVPVRFAGRGVPEEDRVVRSLPTYWFAVNSTGICGSCPRFVDCLRISPK